MSCGSISPASSAAARSVTTVAVPARSCALAWNVRWVPLRSRFVSHTSRPHAISSRFVIAGPERDVGLGRSPFLPVRVRLLLVQVCPQRAGFECTGECLSFQPARMVPELGPLDHFRPVGRSCVCFVHRVFPSTLVCGDFGRVFPRPAVHLPVTSLLHSSHFASVGLTDKCRASMLPALRAITQRRTDVVQVWSRHTSQRGSWGARRRCPADLTRGVSGLNYKSSPVGFTRNIASGAELWFFRPLCVYTGRPRVAIVADRSLGVAALV